MSEITWKQSSEKHSRFYAMQFGRSVGRVSKAGDSWVCSLGSSGSLAVIRFGPRFRSPEAAQAYFEKNWPADLDAELRLGGSL